MAKNKTAVNNHKSSVSELKTERDRRRSFPNSYLMPGFDPSSISDKLESVFRGEGTAVEQTGLYIDPSSGSRWYAVANQPDYADARAGRHYKDIATHIYHHFLQSIDVVDVFALASGDGNNETRLVQNLLTHIKSLNFFLMDVSQPLLNIANAHARAVLGPLMRDHIFTVQGTMHDLAQGGPIQIFTNHNQSALNEL